MPEYTIDWQTKRIIITWLRNKSLSGKPNLSSALSAGYYNKVADELEQEKDFIVHGAKNEGSGTTS